MRIAINGRFLLQSVTGVQKVAIEFLAALDTLLAEGRFPGLTVDLIVPAKGELVTRPQLRAVQMRRAGRLNGHLWEQLELPGLAGTVPLLCLGNLAPVSRLLSRRAPLHVMVHDLSYRYFPAAYSRAFRLLYGAVVPLVLRRATKVYTVSDAEKTAILAHYPRVIDPVRLVAVQNGGGEGATSATVSTEPASLSAGAVGIPSRALRSRSGLYVGSLTRRKNAEGLVRAAIELLRDGLDEMVFVGATGAGFEAVGIDFPPELAGRMRFLGQVNDPVLIEAEYRRASVMLFPSFYESSGLPTTEAMRFGCPVVSADISSLRERCGDAALYCDPARVESIVSQARSALSDGALWDDLQARGLAQAARYSWKSQVLTVLDNMGAKA